MLWTAVVDSATKWNVSFKLSGNIAKNTELTTTFTAVRIANLWDNNFNSPLY